MQAQTPRQRAASVIRETIGVRRVAAYCRVSEATPYQWLSRGTDEHPIPPRYVPMIVQGARGDGIAVDWEALWPGVADAPGPQSEATMVGSAAE